MSSSHRRVVLITGPSGAGLSTASNVLEDAGFEAIDNIPLGLVPSLLDRPDAPRPLALCLDMRNRDFSAQRFLDMMQDLSSRPDLTIELLYVECRPEEILRRYQATRRRHPIDQAPSLPDAIRYEIDLLRPLAVRADILIDSSDMNPHEFRAEVDKWFSQNGQHRTAVQVQSFSYKRGIPRGVDFVFDCRFCVIRIGTWHSVRSMDATRPYRTTSPLTHALRLTSRGFVICASLYFQQRATRVRVTCPSRLAAPGGVTAQ